MTAELKTMGDLFSFGLKQAVQKVELPDDAPEELKGLLSTVKKASSEESTEVKSERAGDDVPLQNGVIDVEGESL